MNRRSLSQSSVVHFGSMNVCNLIDTLRFPFYPKNRLCSLPRRYEQLNHTREQKEIHERTEEDEKNVMNLEKFYDLYVVKANDSCRVRVRVEFNRTLNS